MKEIRVALIGGGGFMGRAHSLGYSVATVMSDAPYRVRKAVLVDAEADTAEKAAAALGWETSSDDWLAVVTSPDVDVVDIVTPPGLHREIALAALAAGKHVFCEKPITNDVAEAIEMAAAARSAGVAHQVGFNYRHMSAVTEARELIASGRLGTPLQFRGVYLHDALYFIEDFGWRGSKTTGGSGATGDIGSHLIDLAQYLCGPIVEVASLRVARDRDQEQGTWLHGPDLDAGGLLDEAATWIGTFDGGAIGTFSAGLWSPGKKNKLTFEVDCSRGSVAFDWNNPDELVVDFIEDTMGPPAPRIIELTQGHQADVWYGVPGLGQGYIDGMGIQLRRFLDAVDAGVPAHPDFDEAVDVQQVVAAVEKSAVTGVRVQVLTDWRVGA